MKRAALFALLLLPALAEAGITIKPGKASGVYAPGETATWIVEGEAPAAGLQYRIRKDGLAVIAEGPLDLSAGPITISATRQDPGALLAQVISPEKPSPALALGGAIFAPEKINPVAPAPEDFDAFWQAKLQELAQVPMNPVLVNKPGPDGLICQLVTLDNIRGTHVRGQLARPAAEGKYPAMLVLQHAGVYALDPKTIVENAKSGWLVLNISAHDQPVAEAAEFYKALDKGELHFYPAIGNEDRETSYFLRMFLGCVRAAEYLTSRPDWDGRILLATGTSQGGLQSLAVAALFPKVSTVIVSMPAGCDTHAPLAGRAQGWPGWGSWGPAGRDREKVMSTSRYFDGINFASRISCPVMAAYGLIDEAARPTGIAAMTNALRGPKEALIMPLANHGLSGSGDLYSGRVAAWKKALLSSQDLPPVP